MGKADAQSVSVSHDIVVLSGFESSDGVKGDFSHYPPQLPEEKALVGENTLRNTPPRFSRQFAPALLPEQNCFTVLEGRGCSFWRRHCGEYAFHGSSLYQRGGMQEGELLMPCFSLEG